MNAMHDHVVIGCGGGGTWLAAKLAKLVGPERLMFVDGDIFEPKNIDRQLFDEHLVGRKKAEAVCDTYPESACDNDYFSCDSLELSSEDILFCCADNHACRKEVLLACDQYDCRAVILGNEYTDAEAYWYESSWKDTPNDPRVFYPAINTDRSGDPLGPPGCVEMQRENKQLVVANDAATTLSLYLYLFHTMERATLHAEDKPYWPVLHRAGLYKLSTVRYGDRA